MITPEQIKQKALQKYSEFLSAYLAGDIFFPLILPCDKTPSKDFKNFQSEIQQLVEYSKDRRGFGYAIEYKEVLKKNFGKQTLPSVIKFESDVDYLRYIQKTKNFSLFKTSIKKILTFPELNGWIESNTKKVIKHSEIWDDLLKVCQYFHHNPFPNLYIRELPIDVHTKFIEENKAIISELLAYIIPEYIDTQESLFEKRFHLKYNEPLIRLLVLDKGFAEQFFSGIDDISVKQSDFERLSIPVENVIILENKTNFSNIYNFLTLPHLDKTIAIFGKGFGLGSLKNAAWLKEVNIFYWGDIDAQGFQILSQLRSYFPEVVSVMMDFRTIELFKDVCGQGKPTTVENLAYLSEEEIALFSYVKNENLRLEQEKIRHDYAAECFKEVFKEKKTLLETKKD